jgi:hypothetical protein
MDLIIRILVTEIRHPALKSTGYCRRRRAAACLTRRLEVFRCFAGELQKIPG